MAIGSTENFLGGYDHAKQAGVVHVANHHIAPGKKQWTWGNHEFGYAWDRNLTDHDGPYIELMAGVYTDNQPDFSFLAPGETQTFEPVLVSDPGDRTGTAGESGCGYQFETRPDSDSNRSVGDAGISGRDSST